MTMQSKILKKLRAELNPELLEVHDESHKHAGHSGSRPGGETHFYVRIQASSLSGLNRVQQHRKIYEILDEELKGTVHALRIEVMD